MWQLCYRHGDQTLIVGHVTAICALCLLQAVCMLQQLQPEQQLHLETQAIQQQPCPEGSHPHSLPLPSRDGNHPLKVRYNTLHQHKPFANMGPLSLNPAVLLIMGVLRLYLCPSLSVEGVAPISCVQT